MKFFLHRSRNAELIITIIDPVLCTSSPITGFRTPAAASMTAAKFSVMEKARRNIFDLKYHKSVEDLKTVCYNRKE